MSLKTTLLATLATVSMAIPAFAEGTITVDDAYARSSGKSAKAGAAFMMIQNQGDTDDRLVGVTSEAAARVELHTHKVDDNGVAKMVHVEEGFAIPAGATHMLKRGGDHVMFMGLTAPFEQDATVPVTLIFEKAGEVEIEIPVDLDRQDKGGHGSHSN
ncbi:copper chaperone PCu(A)C [Ruegeria sp. 6PALISEP08]|uniref:copper chaperone PCu(A)C n=1 Tax=Ruegeria sp. 6PALISEP08 TaxID=1225660 RepID=UPI00067EE92E|nr:copper chaperone PCu(A)C [Ruegeria sp. 6PALISEP08]